jgi:hypothetical protein
MKGIMAEDPILVEIGEMLCRVIRSGKSIREEEVF